MQCWNLRRLLICFTLRNTILVLINLKACLRKGSRIERRKSKANTIGNSWLKSYRRILRQIRMSKTFWLCSRSRRNADTMTPTSVYHRCIWRWTLKLVKLSKGQWLVVKVCKMKLSRIEWPGEGRKSVVLWTGWKDEMGRSSSKPWVLSKSEWRWIVLHRNRVSKSNSQACHHKEWRICLINPWRLNHIPKKGEYKVLSPHLPIWL